MILVKQKTDINEIGGKAYNLFDLDIKNTPPFFVVPCSFFENEKADKIFTERLEKELEAALSDVKKYAVRSSAVGEDSKEASFAGIHESFLNVSKSDVLACIRKVRESAFCSKAIEYRKIKGLPVSDIKIAVIVQEMVDADLAGVIFTIDPVKNDPDKKIICVTEGLGDKIVDGGASGSTYTVNGGEISVSGRDILTKKQISSLLKMTDEVIKKTSAFQDVEFAVVKNKAYFLQARPISGYKDFDPHKRSRTIDDSNIIESYFGVTSHLTYTFAKDVYRDVYTAALRLGGVRESIIKALTPSLSEMLYEYEGKIYYNMQSWYRVNSIFPFKRSSDYMESMMGVGSRANNVKRVRMDLFDTLRFGLRFLNKLRNIDELSDKFEENFNRIVMPHYGKRIEGADKELSDLFCEIERDIVKEFTIPVVNDCAVMIYFGRLKNKAKKLGVSEQEINRYISNNGDVSSAKSATDLMEIVALIRSDEDIGRDFSDLSAGELRRKYRCGTKISDKLNDYRIKYGARVRDELKLETVTMIEDEDLLYSLIKDNLSIEKKEVAAAEVVVPEKLKRLAEKTKKYLRNRERLRIKRTIVYSVVRNIFLAFARNYVKAGRIDDERDIFYLSKSEVMSGKGDFRALIAARKEKEKSDRKKPIYDRIVFFGDLAMPVLKGEIYRGGLRGIPGGSGKITARVSLMDSPEDKLCKGNIILTKRTDPGWISLFPLAGGLIVEHGSMLSHSFVVARELGLPAVVGVAGATSIIKDGDLVTLNGITGEITIEDQRLL